MKTNLCLFNFIAGLTLSPYAMAALLDFEEFPRGTSIPTNRYIASGAQVFNLTVHETGYSGVDGAHSGTKSVVPSGSTSIDGTLADEIVTGHGIPPKYYGTGVADILFVQPGTTIPATVSQFSLWMGFDQTFPQPNGPEVNRFVIEGFNAAGTRIIDYVSDSFQTAAGTFVNFTTAGVHRVRITHSDGVTFDDFSFNLTVQPPCIIAETSFDTDLDGWVSSQSSPTDIDWVDVGGNSGGFLRFRQLPRPGPTYIVAPAKFLGNWIPLNDAGLFSFDQRVIDPGSGITGIQVPTLRISGPGGAAIAVFPVPPPAATPWQTFSVSIRETSFTMLSGTWLALLANVTDVRIKVELFDNSGPPDSTGTDHVVLSRTICGVISQQSILLDPRRTYLRYNRTIDVDPQDGQTLPLGPKVFDLAANGIAPGDFLFLERSGRFRWSASFPTEDGRNVWAAFSQNHTVDDNPDLDRPLDDPPVIYPPKRIPGAVAPNFQQVAAINTGSTITSNPGGEGSPTNIDEDFMADRVLVQVPAGATHLMFGAGDTKWADNLDGPTEDYPNEPPPDFRISLTQIRDPHFDTDGDGTADLDEFLSGTDYANPLSHPFMNISESPLPGNARTEWTAQPFRIYQIEESTDLSSWSLLESLPTVTVPTPMQRDYPLSPLDHFYQLRVIGMFWD